MAMLPGSDLRITPEVFGGPACLARVRSALTAVRLASTPAILAKWLLRSLSMRGLHHLPALDPRVLEPQ